MAGSNDRLGWLARILELMAGMQARGGLTIVSMSEADLDRCFAEEPEAPATPEPAKRQEPPGPVLTAQEIEEVAGLKSLTEMDYALAGAAPEKPVKINELFRLAGRKKNPYSEARLRALVKLSVILHSADGYKRGFRHLPDRDPDTPADWQEAV